MLPGKKKSRKVLWGTTTLAFNGVMLYRSHGGGKKPISAKSQEIAPISPQFRAVNVTKSRFL